MLSLLAAQSMHMYISYKISDDHREKALGRCWKCMCYMETITYPGAQLLRSPSL